MAGDGDFLEGNALLENLIAGWQEEKGEKEEAATVLLISLVNLMNGGGKLLVPTEGEKTGSPAKPRRCKVVLDDGQEALSAFTGFEEMEIDPPADYAIVPMRDFFAEAAGMEGIAGVMLNPWGKRYFLPLQLLQIITGQN